MLMLTVDVMRVPGAPGEAIFSAPGRREGGNLYEVSLGPEWKLMERKMWNLWPEAEVPEQSTERFREQRREKEEQKLQTSRMSQDALSLQPSTALTTKGFLPLRKPSSLLPQSHACTHAGGDSGSH